MDPHLDDTPAVRSKPWSFTRLGLLSVALWALWFCMEIQLYRLMPTEFVAFVTLRVLVLSAAIVILTVFITMATLNKCWSALNIICACIGGVSFAAFVLWLMLCD